MNPNVIIRGESETILSQQTKQSLPAVNVNLQRTFFVTPWQLSDLFNLYDSIAIKICNISKDDKVNFELLPYDDILKRQLLVDFSDDYYFVLFKGDIDFNLGNKLFSFNIVKEDEGTYSIYVSYLNTIPLPKGVHEEPQNNGVLIPNPKPRA